MSRSLSSADNALDAWTASMGLPDTPQTKPSKPGQIERQRREVSRRAQIPGASIADYKHDHAMNEVTQSVQNISLGGRDQASKTVAICAEQVLQEALSYENVGDRVAAIKLVEEAIDDGVQPVLKLQQFLVDLVRRKHVAANLKKDAVRRAIIGPCARTEEPATIQVENAAHVNTPAVVVAPALSFNSMYDHGTAGAKAPNSVATVRSKSPVSLSTPSLPPGALPSNFESPLETNEEDKHEAIGVRMIHNAPAISPVLEPIPCGADDVDLLLNGGQDDSSSCHKASSAPGCGTASEPSQRLSTQSSKRLGGLARSSVRSSISTGVAFSVDPPVLIEPVEEASASDADQPTPQGRARRSLNAGHTPWTASDHAEEHHVTLVEEPTACYPAQKDLSPAASDEPSWAAKPQLSNRLSINAGRTPHRASLVSFAPGNIGVASDAADASPDSAASDAMPGFGMSMSACIEDVPAPQHARRSMNAGHTPKHCNTTLVQFADTPGEARGMDESVGADEWAQAVSAASTPTANSAAPSVEFGDVDVSPGVWDGEGSGPDGDERGVWIVSDDAKQVPQCSKEEQVRRSMNAGHTPAPSRTVSQVGEVPDCCADGDDAASPRATAPLAPVAAEGMDVQAPDTELTDAAARLDFNTHGATRVGGRAGDHVRRVSFAANTADAAAAWGGRPSTGAVITPHALQKPARRSRRITLEVPSTQGASAPTGPRGSTHGPLAGSLFATPVPELTPSLGTNGGGDASTVGGGPVQLGTQRKPTPATGAVHVPHGGVQVEADLVEEVEGPGRTVEDAPWGGANDDGDVGGDREGMQQVDMQQGAVAEGGSGRGSLSELLLPDEAVGAAASPGQSSISFDSPSRNVWGGFGTPVSEASTPSMSAARGSQRSSRQPPVDLAPAPGSLAGSPLSQPSGDVPAFASADGFMPMLTCDTGLSPSLAVPTSTPPPAATAEGGPDSPSRPHAASPGSSSDSLLSDDLLSPEPQAALEEVVQETLPSTEGDELPGEDPQGGTGDGVDPLVRQAFAALSVGEHGSTAGGLPDGVRSREVKALMADPVASAVAASSEMGTHEVLVKVKAAPGQRSAHGTPTVLTPVRRSRRSTSALTPPPDVSAQLADTEWAYAPNLALLQPDVEHGEDEGDADL